MLATVGQFCRSTPVGPQGRRTRRPRAAPLRSVTASSVKSTKQARSSLCLPRLANNVPLTVVPGRIAAANAVIARFLIQAGAIREGDIPAVWDDALDVCRNALDTWVKREIGTLHCLAPVFAMTPLEEDGRVKASDRKMHMRTICYEGVDICWYESRSRQWVVGRKLEWLQQVRLGLGQAVLAVLQHQSTYVYPVYTPEHAFDQAQCFYWFGEQDEESVLDMECGDDLEARAAMRADMITRQDVNEAFPDWTLSIPREASCAKILQRLAVDLPDGEVSDIVSNALALAKMKLNGCYQPVFEGDYLGWGAVLSWREDDLSVRIYDDMANMAYQAEYCERIGELEVQIATPDLLQVWQHDMRKRFKAIQLIDRLIYQLADRY